MTSLPSKCAACLEPWCAQHGCQMLIPSHPAYVPPAASLVYAPPSFFANTVEVLKQFELSYLASPYSKYPTGIDAAFEDVSEIAGRLLKAGVHTYSPIAHSHPISKYGRINPLSHDIWLPLDMKIAVACDALVVAKMATWDISYGIGEEIKTFKSKGLPVFYLDPATLTVSEVAP